MGARDGDGRFEDLILYAETDAEDGLSVGVYGQNRDYRVENWNQNRRVVSDSPEQVLFGGLTVVQIDEQVEEHHAVGKADTHAGHERLNTCAQAKNPRITWSVIVRLSCRCMS